MAGSSRAPSHRRRVGGVGIGGAPVVLLEKGSTGIGGNLGGFQAGATPSKGKAMESVSGDGYNQKRNRTRSADVIGSSGLPRLFPVACFNGSHRSSPGACK
jgi:hypothetical protein